MAEGSRGTVKRRGPGRPFAKGQSGNPGGRKAVPQEVKDMLKAATPDAVKLLVDTMRDEGAKIDVRLDCAKTIMDRVYGKAAQPIDGDVSGVIRVILGEAEEYAD